MFRDRKSLRVVVAPSKAPFHQKVVAPFKNVIRTCFAGAETHTSLATAISIGASVASHVKSQRETQRAAELERYYDLYDIELTNITPPAEDVPEEATVPEVRADECGPEDQDKLSVLPVTKSATELSAIFDGLGTLLSDSQTQLKSAESQLRNAEFKAQAHIDGVSLQLRASTRKIERLEGIVKDLNAEKASLTARAEASEKAAAAAQEKCTRLSGELEMAKKGVRRLEGALSSAGRSSFIGGLLTAAVIGAILVGALYFMGIVH